MTSVMISIQPKWVEKILSGEKTMEVRKSKPKLEIPFKCYIYQTKRNWVYKALSWLGLHQAKVVAEFVCDDISNLHNVATDKWNCLSGGVHDNHKRLVTEQAKLTEQECLDYGGKYAWHISNLVIYDKPKELGEFKQCHKCEYGDRLRCNEMEFSCNGSYNLIRPPQSWGYVESADTAS